MITLKATYHGAAKGTKNILLSQDNFIIQQLLRDTNPLLLYIFHGFMKRSTLVKFKYALHK